MHLVTANPSTGAVTVGLDTWSIDSTSKAFFTSGSNGVYDIGKTSENVNNVFLRNLVIYSGTGFSHTINTSATGPSYTWTTPATKSPSAVFTSLIQVTQAGAMDYSTPTTTTQFLTSAGSAPTWTEQCFISGLNTLNPTLSTTSFLANTANSGIVMNYASATNCLTTLASKGADYVLITDGSNNITWELQSTFISGNAVSSISTAVNGGIITSPSSPNGPSIGAVTLSLDSWTINFGTKALTPGGAYNIGTAASPVSSEYLTTLNLGTNPNYQTIQSGATAPYTWTTPTGNPVGSTSLVTCTTAGALAYATPSGANQILITNGGGTITWINQSAGSVTSITTSDGILTTPNPTLGPSTGAVTLSLDTWSIDATSKAFFTSGSNGVYDIGKAANNVDNVFLRNLVVYSGAGFSHTINTSASGPSYTWTTPAVKAPNATFSLLEVNNTGTIQYSTPTTATQFLSSTGTTPTWTEQCNIANLNLANSNNTGSTISTTIFNASPANAGLVINYGPAVSNCLSTLAAPTSPPAIAASAYVLVADASQNISWEPRSDFASSGTGVTSLSTLAVSTATNGTGLLVSPSGPNGPATGAVTLSLDGWEIFTGSKILRPLSTAGSGTQGRLGDATHVIFDVNVQNTILYNGALTATHTINTGVTTSYTWTTPATRAPSATFTSLITVTQAGALGYATASSTTQFVSSTGSTPTWTEQCNIANLNLANTNNTGSTISTTLFNASPANAGIVINYGPAASNCLSTLAAPTSPPAIAASAYVLVTDAAQKISWEPRSAFASSGSGVTSVASTTTGLLVDGGAGPSTGAVSLSLDGWEIATGSKILRPLTTAGSGTQGRLGDSTHIIFDASIQNIVLYNGALTAAHTIETGVTTSYTWTTPATRAPSATFTSLITVTQTGALDYATASSTTQFVTSSGSTPTWTEQCFIANLNTANTNNTGSTISTTIFNASPANAGLVINYGPASTNCLSTLAAPTSAPAIAASAYVLVTDAAQKISWEPRSAFSSAGSGVTSVASTTTGLLVDGGAGPSTGAVSLSLDGWEIATGSKILRPTANAGSGTQGRLGDSTHIVADMSLQNIILYNGLTNAVTIESGATAAYTLITPDTTIPITGAKNTGLIQATGLGTTTTLSYSQGTVANIMTTDTNSNIRWLGPGSSGQVLTYNGTDLIWSSASGISTLSTATTVATGSGILLNGGTTPTTSNTTFSLNGWGIDPASPFDLLPITTNLSSLGSSSNIVLDVNTGDLILYHTNLLKQTITPGTITTSYTWITPATSVPISGAQNTGLILATGSGTTSTLSYSQGAANNVMITDTNGNIEWLSAGTAGQVLTYGTPITWQTPATGGISLITTQNGFTVGSTINGAIPTNGTLLGLNGWELVGSSPTVSLRPQAGFTTNTLGDSTRFPVSVNTNNMILYNGANTHTINTGVTTSYTWTTPTVNAPISGSKNTSLILATGTGASTTQLSYIQGSADNVMITDINGNVEWLAGGTAGQVLTYGNPITWQTPATGGISIITTQNGLTVGSTVNGTIPTNGTLLGLNGWELVTNGANDVSLRPQSGFTSSTLGDSTRFPLSVNTTDLILYNGTNAHTIDTGATTSYTWITPTGSAPTSGAQDTSLILATGSGSTTTLSYSQGAANSVMITNTNGNVTWEQQCSFAGLNASLASVTYSTSATYGVVANNGTTANACLNTVTPGITVAAARNQIFITDFQGNMTWLPSSTALTGQVLTYTGTGSNIAWASVSTGGGGTVTSVNVTNGLTIGSTATNGTPAGGPLTTTGFIGLDGWEITEPGGAIRTLRPRVASGGFVGKIGDSANVVNEVDLTSLVLYNGLTTHTINTAATPTPYTWTTPAAATTATNNALIMVNSAGTMSYSFPANATQILGSTGTTPTWINIASLGFVTSVTSTTTGLIANPTTGAVSISLDGWEIATGSKILRPTSQTGSGTQGRLGDSGNIIYDISINNVVMYNGSTANAHTINSSVTTSYTWTTPAAACPSASSTAIVTVNNAGTLDYLRQCDIAGLSSNSFSSGGLLGGLTTGNGVVIQIGGPVDNCLGTLSPSPYNNDVRFLGVTPATDIPAFDQVPSSVTVANQLQWINVGDMFPYIDGGDVSTYAGYTNSQISNGAGHIIMSIQGIFGTKPCVKRIASNTTDCGQFIGSIPHGTASGWIDQGDIAGLNVTGIVAGTGSNFDEIMIRNNVTKCMQRILTPSTNGYFLSTDGDSPTPSITWSAENNIAGLNTLVTSVSFSTYTYGAVVNNGNGSTGDVLRTVSPGATSADAANKVLSTDSNGNITWSSLTNTDSLTIFPDGVTKDMVVSIANNNEVVIGFGNEGEEIITRDEIPTNGSLHTHNPYSKDIIYIQTTPISSKIVIGLAYYGNGYGQSVLLGTGISATRTGSVILGKDYASSTYTFAIFNVTGTAPNFTLNFDIFSVTGHSISFVGTTTTAFTTVAGSPTPTVDSSTTLDVTYNRDYIIVGCFYNGNAYLGAYQLSAGVLTTATAVQTVGPFASLSTATGNYFSTIRSNTTANNVYTIGMVVNNGAAKDNIVALYYTVATLTFSSTGQTATIASNMLATNSAVHFTQLLPAWDKTAATSQHFLIIEDSESTRLPYWSKLTIDSTADTISVGNEALLYPSSSPALDPIENRTFTSNLEMGPTFIDNNSDPVIVFAYTYRSLALYNESPLITVPFSYNITANSLVIGPDNVTQPTIDNSGKTLSFFDTPLFQAVYSGTTDFIAATLTTTNNVDLIVLVGSITQDSDQTYTSVIANNLAFNTVTDTSTITTYRHRGQGPYGVSQTTGTSGTATITIQGTHSLTSPPASSVREVLWAHGNGVLSKERRVNTTFPYPNYIPVPRYAIYKNGSLVIL